MSDIDFSAEVVEEAAEQTPADLAILDAFNESIEAGQDETNIKLNMIKAGADFKNVTRLYNKFMVDAGLAISKEDRTRLVEETLTGKVFDTEEDFSVAIENLMTAIEGTSDRSAASIIRAYAKKNELPVWSKPKSEGGSRPGFAAAFHDFLIANLNCTKEQVTAYIMGTDGNAPTSENVQNHLGVYMSQWNLVQRAAEQARKSA